MTIPYIKPIIALMFVLVVATFLRIYDLNITPVALFGDEVDVGYQAYSLLTTGADMSGRYLPTYLRSVAEYRAPLYLYSAVPFVGIFGLNEWGVRLPAAFWGVISILGTYLLVSNLFTKRVGLVAAAILAISPWHLQYSRGSFEVTMLLAFEVWAAYLYVLAKKKWWLYLLSFFLFGLTLYIYNTATILTPVIMLCLLATNYKEVVFNKKILVYGGLVLFLTALPLMISLYTGEARERFGIVSIFQDKVELDKINIARISQRFVDTEGQLIITDPTIEAYFHNKPLVFGQVFALNYLRAFSLEFLFAQGDPNFRHSIHELGQLHIYELPLVLIGLFFLLSKATKNQKIIILGWLLVAPLPAALTYDGGYHATRLFLIVFPLAVIAALGFEMLLKSKIRFNKILLVLILIVAFSNGVLYLHRYHSHYKIESWRWWHYGFKQAMSYVGENQNKYSTVIINNSHEPAVERYLYFTKYDPAVFQKQFTQTAKEQENVLAGVNGFTLDNKIYFGYINDQGHQRRLDEVIKPGTLMVASARDDVKSDLRNANNLEHVRLLKTIVNPFNEPIFYILEGTTDELKK